MKKASIIKQHTPYTVDPIYLYFLGHYQPVDGATVSPDQVELM